ncbi:hypothetical protein GQ43DRAFT_474328 [Delitschia confertaspora ATCC 74209]|uniref:Uncharacterized protein n=1 Tax=Delitschia confertaspora ATCC 74209 TaxID=1513339 RepID=A0A9P4JL39_9PLEO|nr:hypothetical protein GQ43DRAFT_474328 [Delitschia confertaspora ATCC 74209]
MATQPKKKRIQFALKIDSETEHFYERVEHHDKKGKTRVKEINTPRSGSTSFTVTGNPYEKKIETITEGTRTERFETDDTEEKRKNKGKTNKKRVEVLYDISDL